jgi:phage major head subunit gpT-like protein
LSDWLCGACPATYDGSDTGITNSNTNVYALLAVGTKSSIKVKVADKVYACANTDATKCDFTRSGEATMPKVDSLTKTDTTIVFTGKNFYTTDHVGKAKFMGIQADSVVANSATQVTATWTTGVPTTSSTKEYPVLYFVKTLVTTPCVVIAGEACTGADKVKVES